MNTHMPKDRVTGQHQGEYTAKSTVTYGGDRLLLEVSSDIKFWSEQTKDFVSGTILN